MEKYRDIIDKHENELRAVFKKAAQLTHTVFGNNAFKLHVLLWPGQRGK